MFDLSSQNYEIKEELQIRKILENNTSHLWIFDKNDNPYDYDLKAWKYDIYEDGKYNKILKGFVEVEVGNGWVDEWPSHYYCVSFLYRKIYKFDRENNAWKEPKDNVENTFYIKFNMSLTDCFCLLIDDIIKKGKPSSRNRETGKYNNSFCEVDKSDVVWGIKNCIQYINKRLEP